MRKLFWIQRRVRVLDVFLPKHACGVCRSGVADLEAECEQTVSFAGCWLCVRCKTLKEPGLRLCARGVADKKEFSKCALPGITPEHLAFAAAQMRQCRRCAAWPCREPASCASLAACPKDARSAAASQAATSVTRLQLVLQAAKCYLHIAGVLQWA